MKSCSFIIVAAGKGSRLGGQPKQYRKLADIPVWQWSFQLAKKMLSESLIKEIIVVVPENDVKELKEKHSTEEIHFVKGGEMRSESVLNGLSSSTAENVLIHDAARPFLSKELCIKLIEKLHTENAVIPVISITDSVKYIESETVKSLDRKNYYIAQTPQAFNRNKIMELLRKNSSATDEATLWTDNYNTICTVDGDINNFKITTQFDWEVAVNMVSQKEIRTGHGFDVHKLVKDRKLILAGVEIKSTMGLLGHSDADIITHTVMDAILGAAGESDIGTLFPASDNKWKNANSINLLKAVLCRIREKGWHIDWIDATLNTQFPKLGGIIEKLKDNLQKYLKEADTAINFNLKVKSGEECGSVGRVECMKCHAVATLSRIKIK